VSAVTVVVEGVQAILSYYVQVSAVAGKAAQCTATERAANK